MLDGVIAFVKLTFLPAILVVGSHTTRGENQRSLKFDKNFPDRGIEPRAAALCESRDSIERRQC